MIQRRFVFLLILIASLAMAYQDAQAARIYLVNDESLTGKILAEDDLSITLQVGQVKVPLLKSQIVSIEDDQGNKRLIEHPTPIPQAITGPETEEPSQPGEIVAPTPPMKNAEHIEPMLPIVLPLGKTYQVNAGLLNVRKGPSTDFEKIASLPNGTVVVQLREEGSWRQVRLPNSSLGWVSARYLTPLRDDLVACSGERVNLRQNAGTNYKILRKISKEEILLMLQQEGDWVQLRDSEGIIGWAVARFFEKLDGPASVMPDYARLTPGALDGILLEKQEPVEGSIAQTVELKLNDSKWVHGGRIALLFEATDPDHAEWEDLIQSKDIAHKSMLFGRNIGKRLGIDESLLEQGNAIQLVILKGYLENSHWVFEYRLTQPRSLRLTRMLVGQKGSRRGALYLF